MLSTFTPGGNLQFIAEPDDIEHLQLLIQRHGGDDLGFLADMLDHYGFSGNNRLHSINPEDVGALTCAPLVTDELDVLDDGRRRVRGEVWWYPSYEVSSFAEVLIREMKVAFQKAH